MHKFPPKKEGFFCVGLIATVHGIKGEVVVKPFTQNPKNILDYGALVNLTGVPFSLSHLRVTAKGVIARVEGVQNRNDAERLKGTYLYAEVGSLPEAEEGNMYLDDLIGTKVYLEDGTLFGTVHHHFDNGAQTIISVQSSTEEQKDILLPFIDAVVLSVNQAEKSMTVSDMALEFAELS